MSRLFIAEKPELARAVVDGLGGGKKQDTHYVCSGGDIVTWCIGSMIRLYDPHEYDERYKKWSMDDLPIAIKDLKFKPVENTQAQLYAIKELMLDADELVNACDLDDMGQKIFDEIMDFFGNTKPVKRLITNDNNIIVMKRALSNLKNNQDYYSLYQSAKARAVGDQLYGYNMTRAFTLAAQQKGFDGVINIGRVKTPILGLVVARDKLNASHTKHSYIDVSANFLFDENSITAKLIVPETIEMDDAGRLLDADFSKKIKLDCEGKKVLTVSVDAKNKSEKAPLPFNMLMLQSECSKRFNLTPKEVMKISQSLRDKGMCSYNGTDAQYLNEESHLDAPDVLKSVLSNTDIFNGIASKIDSSIKGRVFNNEFVSAHHAIIPTMTKHDVTKLTKNEREVYELISLYYVVQFLPDHKFTQSKIMFSCGSHDFTCTIKKTISSGWREIFENKDDNNASDKEEIINTDGSFLKEGLQGNCKLVSLSNKETKPPALYTMSSLLLDLTRISKYIIDPKLKKIMIDKDKDKKGENGGIGTSRTRDILIDSLFGGGYLTNKGKSIVSTDLGKTLVDVLPQICTSPDMTAIWHEQQVRIKNDTYTYDGFVDKLNGFIAAQITNVKKTGIAIKTVKYPCGKCNSDLRKRRSKQDNSIFWGCSNYPDCSFQVSDKGGEPDFKSLETVPCNACKTPMQRRKGKFGFYWPCPSPTCDKTYDDNRGKPDFTPLFPCKVCNTLMKRIKGKHGFFWPCPSPTCDKIYNDMRGKPDYEMKKKFTKKAS